MGYGPRVLKSTVKIPTSPWPVDVETLKILIDTHTNFYPLSRRPGGVADRIKDRLTFPTPAFQEAQKRGFYTGDIPQEVQGCRFLQETDR
jgi:hypothetical protein